MRHFERRDLGGQTDTEGGGPDRRPTPHSHQPNPCRSVSRSPRDHGGERAPAGGLIHETPDEPIHVPLKGGGAAVENRPIQNRILK